MNKSNGMGFVGTVFIVFLILKLIGVITWSWWWVLAPLWAGIALIGLFLLITYIIVVITVLIEEK